MYVCVCVCVCMYACMYIYVCMYMYVCIYLYMCLYMYRQKFDAEPTQKFDISIVDWLKIIGIPEKDASIIGINFMYASLHSTYG